MARAWISGLWVSGYSGEEGGSGAGSSGGGGMGGSDSPEELLWRVNYDELNRRFRHKSCVALVRQKMGAEAASTPSMAFGYLMRNHAASIPP